MRIKLSELRRIIRETLAAEATDVEESPFSWKVAKAAEDDEESVDIGGKKYPVTMSKEKAKKITGKNQDKY